MKLTRIAATAAPAILLLAASSTSWANCTDIGPYQCVSGVVHFEAAPNGCYKITVNPSEGGDPMEFALQYSLPMTLVDALNLLSKETALADGSARSLLYTGVKSSCSGHPTLLDGPVRKQ